MRKASVETPDQISQAERNAKNISLVTTSYNIFIAKAESQQKSIEV